MRFYNDVYLMSFGRFHRKNSTFIRNFFLDIEIFCIFMFPVAIHSLVWHARASIDNFFIFQSSHYNLYVQKILHYCKKWINYVLDLDILHFGKSL